MLSIVVGFEAATKDWVFYTDGDGQYDVVELRVLMDALTPDVDVVNGYKIARSDLWYRKGIGIVYREWMRLLFRFQVRDVNCDFRLIRRSLMDRISLTHTSGVVCVEMVKKLERAGARFVNVPVHHFPRLHGGSQFFKLGRLVETFVDAGRLWFSLR